MGGSSQTPATVCYTAPSLVFARGWPLRRSSRVLCWRFSGNAPVGLNTYQKHRHRIPIRGEPGEGVPPDAEDPTGYPFAATPLPLTTPPGALLCPSIPLPRSSCSYSRSQTGPAVCSCGVEGVRSRMTEHEAGSRKKSLSLALEPDSGGVPAVSLYFRGQQVGFLQGMSLEPSFFTWFCHFHRHLGGRGSGRPSVYGDLGSQKL